MGKVERAEERENARAARQRAEARAEEWAAADAKQNANVAPMIEKWLQARPRARGVGLKLWDAMLEARIWGGDAFGEAAFRIMFWLTSEMKIIIESGAIDYESSLSVVDVFVAKLNLLEPEEPEYAFFDFNDDEGIDESAPQRPPRATFSRRRGRVQRRLRTPRRGG